jgi:hypothetical protein
MKILYTFSLFLFCTTLLPGQSKTVYFDLAHGQRFWNDPKDPQPNIGLNDSTRIQYLNHELNKTLAGLDAKVTFLKKNIRFNQLKKADALVLHVPYSKYTQPEIKAIQKYINRGGNLLLVMEADYWTDNEKTNVNEILKPYKIQYGQQSKDSLAGGYTVKGVLHSEQLKVTYQFGREVSGGTSFSFNAQDGQPFGVYKETKNGGRLVVLGDAMSSLYMTEWRGVSDYQCHEFMRGIYQWLLSE